MIGLWRAAQKQKWGRNERLLVSAFLEKAELEKKTVCSGNERRRKGEIVSRVTE